MGHQVRLPRGKSRPGARGTRKPRAHNPVPGRVSSDAFQVFGERQRREFDSSPWPMRIFEHGSFRFLAVNDAAVKLYGYTREEFLAMTAKDTRHPEELDDFLTMLAEPTGYFTHRGPRRHVKKNGEVIVVEAVTQDILFNGRKARLSMNIDVTQRHRAEDELSRQRKILDAIIENLPVGIFIRDAKTFRYVMRKRFAECLYTCSVKDSIGKTVHDLFPREQAELFSKTDREALETGRMVENPELEVIWESGHRKIYHVRKVPLFDDHGEPWLIVGIADDITERKKVERVLHESEIKYRNLVESSSDLIWSADAAGRITFINQAVRQIYGYEPEEMLGRPVVEFLGEGNRKKSFGFFRRMLSEDRSWADYECEVRHKNGQPVILSSNAIVLRDGEGNRIGVTGISKDITDRKRAEQERLTHAIHQRDALVREVHHRLKNHLQGIVGLLRGKASGDPAVAQVIEAAAVQLQSVAIVYGLQNESAEGGVPLRRVLEAICAAVESLNGGRVVRRFPAETADALRLAETEAVPVAVALNELVFNALKHCAAPGGARLIEVVLAEKKGSAEVRIVNSGKLSTGFDYTRGAGTGTGLDLVRTLLGTAGSSLSFNVRDSEVEVTLSLRPPILVTARTQEAVT